MFFEVDSWSILGGFGASKWLKMTNATWIFQYCPKMLRKRRHAPNHAKTIGCSIIFCFHNVKKIRKVKKIWSRCHFSWGCFVERFLIDFGTVLGPVWDTFWTSFHEPSISRKPCFTEVKQGIWRYSHFNFSCIVHTFSIFVSASTFVSIVLSSFGQFWIPKWLQQ